VIQAQRCEKIQKKTQKINQNATNHHVLVAFLLLSENPALDAGMVFAEKKVS
jgi:hypothetical protein